ncbi:hypothetical protein SDC9_134915 [bioreactor metagenome]|uniref:Uncharacterized protein n=1 Tax=bioreactor metagenome TaxID=1076179 RepID=A0A645DF22_9ZZZZ
MGQRRCFIGQDFLGAVDAAVGLRAQAFHFRHRQRGEKGQQFPELRIVAIAPELVVVENRRPLHVKPDIVAAGGFAELHAVAVEQQRKGHAEDFILRHAADQIDSGDHIAPLILAAELHLAVVIAVQDVKVIRLKNGVIEFQKTQPAFEAHLHRLLGQHFVDAELIADFAQKIEIFHLGEPVGVVHENRPVDGDEARQLAAQAIDIVRHLFLGQNRARGQLSRRIADLSGSAADQHDRLVTATLQQPHGHDRQQVADMETAPGRIEAHIERDFFAVEQGGDFFGVGFLVGETAGFQLIVGVHTSSTVFDVQIRRFQASCI